MILLIADNVAKINILEKIILKLTVSSSVIETTAGVILSPASLARTSTLPSSCKYFEY